MINLISAGAKRNLKAARLNVVLLTYCVIVGCTVISVGLLGLFSYWWLDNTIALAQSEQAANIAQTTPYASVQRDAATFKANLAKTQAVIASRSHYSVAFLNVASSLPSGAYISSVTFAPTFLTTPVQVSAVTASNQAALALKDTLSKSPIYSKVTLDNVNCANGRCQVAITATLSQAVFTPGATE